MGYIHKILSVVTVVVLFAGCGNNSKTSQHISFADEVRLPMTPVKNQGSSSLCWAYAMLATIETEHITRGDSVNLSAAYVARMFMREQVDRCFFSKGARKISTRGVMPQLIRLIQTYGLMPYDSYHSDCNMNATALKLRNMIKTEAMAGWGLKRTRTDADRLMDNSINPLPFHVYMYSMEYTPLEFAHSVCMPDEYQAFTSFTHIPMNRKAVLSLPDNYNNEKFLNVSLNNMMNIMERSLRSGHPVCWEGDISEDGFSFEKGAADVPENKRNARQELRQREFETFRTTDDHCMAIIGIAHDKQGRKYFICKNSWGTENRYGGLMYMSFDYARLKTIAIMVNNLALS